MKANALRSVGVIALGGLRRDELGVPTWAGGRRP